MRKTLVTGLGVAMALTTGLGLALAAPASASHGSSHNSGPCTAGSTWDIKANAKSGDPGTIDVSFRISSHEGGQTWDWTLTDRGFHRSDVVASGEDTAASNGKLDVKQTIPNPLGPDLIRLDATNAATGETCTGHVVVTGHK